MALIDGCVALPWSDLQDDQAEGRAAHLRVWEDRAYRCKGDSPHFSAVYIPSPVMDDHVVIAAV